MINERKRSKKRLMFSTKRPRTDSINSINYLTNFDEDLLADELERIPTPTTQLHYDLSRPVSRPISKPISKPISNRKIDRDHGGRSLSSLNKRRERDRESRIRKANTFEELKRENAELRQSNAELRARLAKYES